MKNPLAFGLLLFLGTGLVLTSAPLCAQTLTADEVLAKNAVATGEAGAADIKTMVAHTTVTLVNGMEIQSVQYVKSPDKLLMKQSIASMSVEMTQGCDGDNCYANDPYMGLRKLEGQEKEQFLFQNDFAASLDYKKLYDKREYLGMGDLEGKKVHKVGLSTTSGMKLVNYYDSADFMLLKSDITVTGPMGTMTAESFFDEYREVHKGFKMMARGRIKAMQMDGTITMGEIEVNTEIPDSLFSAPEGLK